MAKLDKELLEVNAAKCDQHHQWHNEETGADPLRVGQGDGQMVNDRVDQPDRKEGQHGDRYQQRFCAGSLAPGLVYTEVNEECQPDQPNVKIHFPPAKGHDPAGKSFRWRFKYDHCRKQVGYGGKAGDKVFPAPQELDRRRQKAEQAEQQAEKNGLASRQEVFLWEKQPPDQQEDPAPYDKVESALQ